MNVYTQKYSNNANAMQSGASKSIGILSQSISIMNQAKHLDSSNERELCRQKLYEISELFRGLFDCVSSPALGQWGADMQIVYFNMSMKHNLMIMEGLDDEKSDAAIKRLEELKAYWQKIIDMAHQGEKEAPDLI